MKRIVEGILLLQPIAILLIACCQAQTLPASVGATEGRVVFDSSSTRFLHFDPETGAIGGGPGNLDNSKYISNIASWLDNGNKKILVYMSYQDGAASPESNLLAFLPSQGYTVDVHYRSGEDITSSLLSSYGQIWFIDNSMTALSSPITQAEKDAVMAFYNNKGSIMLTGEQYCIGTSSLNYMVGAIAPAFNVAMSDCLDIGDVATDVHSSIKPVFTSHPVVAGVTSVSTSGSDIKIVSSNPSTIVVATVKGQPYILVLNAGAVSTTTTTAGSTTTPSGGTTTTTSGSSTTTTTPVYHDPYQYIIIRINEVVCLILNLLFYITAAIFAMMLILAGFKYLTSDDPSTVHNAKMMTVYALLGFVLVVIACPLVDYLIAGSDIVPFTKSCNCLLGPGGGSIPTTTTITPVKCVDGTPHGQCSTAHVGFRCVGPSTAPVLQLDTSCGGTSTTSSVSTTTPASTTTSSSTTTTMCGSKKLCWIAETGSAGNTCGGLYITCGLGTMENCCTNYHCCCSPASGCTYP